MIHSGFAPGHLNFWYLLLACCFLTALPCSTIWGQGTALPSSTDESESALSGAIKEVSNSEVDWRGTTFGHAGPKLAGANVSIIFEEGVGVSSQLLPLLERDESFVAAHVLLTELWRVSDKDKGRHSTTTRSGYSLNYNGLKVMLEWTEEAGKIIKLTNIPDPSSQRMRLMNWWKARYRDYPTEFSPKTFVE